MKSRTFRSRVLAPLLIAICCRLANSQGDDLHNKITDYWRFHTCEGRCRNPIIEVRSDVVKVVRFDDGRPRDEYVGVQELRAFLKGMPLSAWPKGPRLWLRESDNVVIAQGSDAEKVRTDRHRMMTSVVQICNELGLTRTREDGTPLTTED